MQYLRIEKDFENDEKVIYKYGTSLEELFEKLELVKSYKDFKNVSEIEALFTRIEETICFERGVYMRAMVTIIKYIQKNPDDKYTDILIHATG